jgi:hypothetical protein
MQHQGILAAIVRLRSALEESADALASPTLDGLLAAELAIESALAAPGMGTASP